MKVRWGNVRLFAIAASSAVALAACPLPYDYHGKGAGGSTAADPSTPKLTESVILTYAVEGGGSGTMPASQPLVTGRATTVTLSTATDNAVIYYTDDGTTVTDFSKAKKISGSSGSFTVNAALPQLLKIDAVAVGPNMLPSLHSHAEVQVQDKPVLAISCVPASTPDNGPPIVFAVTSSFAPANNLTINLTTSGSYSTSDAIGIGGPGNNLVLTIPANATSISQTVTPRHVPGNHSTKTVTLSLAAGSYAIATGQGSTSAAITSTSPVPVLTMNTFTTTVPNGQSAMVTVAASLPPEVDLTVPINSSGYKTGKASVPSSVTIAAGTTSAKFYVSASAGQYYEEQDVTVSFAAPASGAGYKLGSPSALTIQAVDSTLGPFKFDGVWKFASSTVSKVGTGVGWSTYGNVTSTGGQLHFDGNVNVNYAVAPITGWGAVFDKTRFTLGVRFTVESLSFMRPIIVAGHPTWRAVVPWVDANGGLHVDFNSHGRLMAGDDPAYNFTIPGVNISAGTTYTFVMNVDAANHVANVWLNGTLATITLPSYFTLEWPDCINLASEDDGYPTAFQGTWDWVFAANGLLDYNTVVNMIASDPDL